MKKLLALVAALLLPCAALAETRLYAVNVGKADCLLLFSGESVYMIDTGTEDSWSCVEAALADFGVDQLTGVFLTHTDDDHAGGAARLAASGVTVGHWYAPAYYSGVKLKKHPAVKAAGSMGMEVEWLSAGMTVLLDGGTLTVLGPIVSSEKENNNSLVLLAETADGSMLLTGDMETPEEETLIDAGVLRQVDVLKVANHGEKDATSETLVNLTRPTVAVISTDSSEEKDTPAGRVLRALKAVDAAIYVTQYANRGILVTLEDGVVSVEMR